MLIIDTHSVIRIHTVGYNLFIGNFDIDIPS